MYKKALFLFIASLFLVGLSACGNEETLTDTQKLLNLKQTIVIDETEITEDLILPDVEEMEGLTVTWTSNKPEYLDIDGTVTRPSQSVGDQRVQLSVKLTLNGIESTKVFDITVLADDTLTDADIVNNVLDSITFDNLELTEDLVLPTITEDVIVTWTSSRESALNNEGIIVRPAYNEEDKEVVLLVTVGKGDYTKSKEFTFTVLKEVRPDFIELDTQFTDALSMDFTYEGKSFINDGYGEVDLVRCVDGDTAIFTEGSGSFSVRFLGINTPESTYKFEPWGKAASDYTCDKLTNATTIVLEYDISSEARTDGNGRYLGWVWYDGRLLNLELVEEAYTGSKGVGGSKYENTFYTAEFKTQDSDRRIWGEDDPDFDYSLDGVQITIEELVTNQEEYVGKKVVIRGIISRSIGGHPYIQDNGYGIYLFKGFDFTTKLAEGNEVLLSGLTLTYYPDAETGAPQLTGFSRTNVEVLSEGNVVDPIETLVTDISDTHVGSLVKVLNLTVVSIYENSYDSAFTVTAEDQDGNVISIRRDDSANIDIIADLFTVGTTFDIIAPVGRYGGEYQLMISKIEDLILD